jgi:hypothetical protein
MNANLLCVIRALASDELGMDDLLSPIRFPVDVGRFLGGALRRISLHEGNLAATSHSMAGQSRGRRIARLPRQGPTIHVIRHNPGPT